MPALRAQVWSSLIVQVSNTTRIVSNGEKSVTLGTPGTAVLWRCTKGSLGTIGSRNVGATAAITQLSVQP